MKPNSNIHDKAQIFYASNDTSLLKRGLKNYPGSTNKQDKREKNERKKRLVASDGHNNIDVPAMPATPGCNVYASCKSLPLQGFSRIRTDFILPFESISVISSRSVYKKSKSINLQNEQPEDSL